MKKAIIILATVLLCQNVFAAQSAQELFTDANSTDDGTAITIEDAVRIALADNTSVTSAVKQRDIYKAQVQEYTSYVYPSLDFSGNYTYNIEKPAFIIGGSKVVVGQSNVYTAGLQANWLVWSGGQVKSGIRIAKEANILGDYNLRSVRDDIERQVLNMCYAIILANAVSKVQAGRLEIAQQNLEEMREKYKQGLSSNLDLLSQEVNVANIEPLVIQANNNYELGTLYLKRLLNRDPEDKIHLVWNGTKTEIPEIKDLPELYKLAENNRADLVLSRANMNIAEEYIKVAKADRMPSVSIFGNRTYNEQTDSVLPGGGDHYWTSSAGIQLSWPVFEGFKTTSIIKQKQFVYERAVQDYDDLHTQVRISIKESVLQLEEAKQRMGSGDTVINQSMENLEALRKRYRAGLASRLELDDAVLALTNAQLTYVQAVHDALSALADLRFNVGTEVKK